ncbi:restriction endonuclease subunit S [Photobacterium damselae subsp. damselae]|uniref:Restriction endonuclease subunit S n=1 Tax=Photobacterium damselae subsp. damselae TaxID=85581 RepID=A0A850QZP0_PHODD|nr:restriction endonuclease subunit S [Photobacterium damselae subsp. damselae]
MVPNGFQHIIGLGNFPCDWLISSADEITEKITKGTTPPKSEIVEDSNIPFLRVNNLGFDGVLNSKSEMLFVTKQAHNGFLSRSVAYPNDILMNIVGPPLGKIAILDDQYPEYNMNQAVLIYRCKEKLIDNGYFLSFLGSELAQQWLQSRSKKTSGQQNLTIQLCKELPTPVPPLPEQRKIAQVLSTWDRAIATTEKLIDASKQQKKALMQQLLTGKKRLIDPETGKAFEGEWAYVQAGSIFATRSNKKHNSDLPILAITQDQGAVPRELIDYNVSVTQGSIAGYKVVEIGDFIISLRSFQGGIEYSKYKGICSPAYVILYPKIEISDDFYKYHLKSFSFIQAMKSRLEGIRDGKIISYKYFSEIKLPQPSLKEQQKIASVLTTADKEIELLEAKLAHFKQEKKALMQQLLTGKRRVNIAEIKVATEETLEAEVA